MAGHATRMVPRVGMAVRIDHFGSTEFTEITAVSEGGRTVAVGDRRFTLRPLTGHYVLEHGPYYGVRLTLLG